MNLKLVFTMLTLVSWSAQASNYPAEDLAIGTEIVVLKDISFPSQWTGVWIQDGKVLTNEGTSTLDSLKAHCWLTVNLGQYNPEVGQTSPINKGNYRVESSLDTNASKGSTGWMVKSDDGKEFHLQCSKSASLITSAADSVGLAHKISADNLFKIRIKNVKKTLKGLMEIKD